MAVLEVAATYLEDELVRIEFRDSHLVSDHPPVLGGAGKGPNPGELLVAALTSATVFAADAEAARKGARTGPVTARADFRTTREGIDGPLPAIGYLSRLWRQIEVNDRAGEALSFGNGIASSLRAGITIAESCEFSVEGAQRFEHRRRNTVFLDKEKAVEGLAPGETVGAPYQAKWRANARLIDDDTSLLQTTGGLLVVGREAGLGHGPSPYELLLASLATCTAIYIGRNAPFHGIPANRISVTVRADCAEGLDTPLAHIEKRTHIIGDLSTDEKEKCAFFADNCAIGETLKRGTELTDQIRVTGSTDGSRAAGLGALWSSGRPTEIDCDDGSCCI